jgi:hypothetical protein
MMIAEELQGSWDQPTRTVVMHNMDASRLQELAVQFADKAMLLVDLNERALAYRTGKGTTACCTPCQHACSSLPCSHLCGAWELVMMGCA